MPAQTDPVLVQLDRLLDDDQIYQQVRADLACRYRLTPVHGRHSPLPKYFCAYSLCNTCTRGVTRRPWNGWPIP